MENKILMAATYRRFLDAEAARVRTDAMALVRSQELTGAATSLDFSWPCNHEIKIDLR